MIWKIINLSSFIGFLGVLVFWIWMFSTGLVTWDYLLLRY